jgi:hypothetical protein
MRYLVIYEAFKSGSLSKTFKWVNDKSVDPFKRDLLSISNYINLPLSEFTDDMFKYLPYEEASEFNDGGDYLKFWFNSNGDYNGMSTNNVDDPGYKIR